MPAKLLPVILLFAYLLAAILCILPSPLGMPNPFLQPAPTIPGGATCNYVGLKEEEYISNDEDGDAYAGEEANMAWRLSGRGTAYKRQGEMKRNE